MKYKYVFTIFTVIIVTAITFSVANAQNPNKTINDDSNIVVNSQENINLNLDAQALSSANLGTSITVKDKDASSTEVKNNNATTTANVQGKLMSETHRSVVAAFVQSLLNIADREGGIGAQVREIAKAQNDSATTTDAAIKKVESRGPVKTFFFGSDYKNLGVIRSEMATTSNNITQLKSLLDKTTSNTDRTEINNQIQILESEQIKLDAYVTTHENIFSLFGWFTKLFAK